MAETNTRLRPHRVPFLEAQRPVVEAGRQPEAELGQRRFAPEVAPEHAADLRHGDVAFVHEDQRVVGQVFEQRRRRLARQAAREPARIILDAVAGAGRLDHLDVELRALLQPLRFQQPAGGVEALKLLLQLLLNAHDRLVQRRLRRHIVRIRVNLHQREVLRLLARERVELGDAFHLVAEHGDAPGAVLLVGREQFDGVAAHPEIAAREADIVALVLQRHEIGQQLALRHPVAHLDRERHRRIGFDRADTVNARDRGHDDDVVALEQRTRGGVAHAVDLLVDRAVLLDIGVGARDIGFRLVVVVIGDEILDRVIREERLELAIKLRRERLVGRQDQRGPLRFLDHLRHGEGLAGTRHAEQHLVALALAHPRHQFADGLWLIAARLEVRFDDKAPAALALLRTRRAMRHEHRHIVAGEQRMVADGRQLALQVRRLRHRARRLQIAQRGDEMLGALGGVDLILERSLRPFGKAGRLAVSRLLDNLFVPGR